MAPEPMPPDDGEAAKTDYVFDTRPIDRLRELQREGLVPKDWTELPAGFDEGKARADVKTREQIAALLEERAAVGATDPARTALIDAEIARFEARLDAERA
jgi:hypothetical protein